MSTKERHPATAFRPLPGGPMSLPGVTRRRTDRPWRALVVLVTVLFGWQSISVPAVAQDSGPAPLSEAQLEQLVAPIALYPDSLLAQILMASTYPLEVVEAARWSKQNPKVTGDALEAAMQKQSWDASVKSLTAFPEVLEMMNEKLDLTQQLGDAFLAQQKEVMDAVQRLRQKANSEGNLESNEQQKVIVEQAPAGSSEPTVIQIQPANPQVVYVPSYNPAVVYGSWPYPSYPPYSYYPPGYAWGAAAVSFGVGMAVGAALWGNCNWGYGNVGINVNNYNNFNRTNISNGNWNHNVNHRKGVGYRDRATGQRYGRDSGRRDQSRDSFRGRAEQGRRDIARGGADGFKGDRGRGAQGRGDVGRAGAQGNRGARAGTQSARSDTRGSRSGSGSRSAAQRPSSARGSSAFSGSRGSGAQARQQASRGRTSRQSASAWGGSRGGSGYSRGGGGRSGGSGFSRGGGGGRGGGGRGGGGRRR